MTLPPSAPTARAAVILLAVASLAGHALDLPQPPAQPEQSMKGAVLKGKAPVSNDILRVKLPPAQETDLSSGALLLVLEDHRVPSVSVQILVSGAGGYYDPPDHPGLAEFTASMMREGTATKSARQIAEALETMAASLSVSTSLSSQVATVAGSSLTERFPQLLDLAADVLLNPSFPDEELTRFKTRTRAGLMQERTNPAFLAGERFARAVYGDHPAGRVTTSPAVLDKTTRNDLLAFHKARFLPDHAVIGVAGDITLAEARKLLEARLADWRKGGTPVPAVQDPAPIGGARVFLVERPGSVQTNLIVGTQAISRTSPDYHTLAVANQVIGGGPSSRLFMILREEKGYTYGAGSGFRALRYRGDWRASTSVRTEVTEPALAELMAQVARVRDEQIPPKELADAKRSMVASFALELESPGAVLSNHITRYLYKLPADYWDTYPDRIMAVTADQAQQAARKHFDPARLQIVAVGDASKVEAVLKKYGTVERYDSEGKAVGSTNSRDNF